MSRIVKSRNIFGLLIGQYALPVLLAAALVVSTQNGIAGTTTAEGGIITTNGSYLIHTFTNYLETTNFIVTGDSLNCDVLVVAGGGGGCQGGGGGGGVLYTNFFNVPAGTTTVTIGAGGGGGYAGAAAKPNGTNGENSIFGSFTAIGGGGGGAYNSNGVAGGSGGGAGLMTDEPSTRTGGVAIAGQGNAGGNTTNRSNLYPMSGGGGASEIGQNTQSREISGRGGNGITLDISGVSTQYAGGGGGGHWTYNTETRAGIGGAGGGGGGSSGIADGTNGAPNTGGGGGGSGGQSGGPGSSIGGSGGSGIVIVRYYNAYGPSAGFPYYDNFESYANLTPLVYGINGWYASSTNVIVQTRVVSSGAQAAMIPPEATLSNRFQGGETTNVWIQMDMFPALRESPDFPVVDTNAAMMFYIDTNGHFVVHDGPTDDPTNSLNWVTNSAGGLDTNALTWVRINIYQDFENTNWSLYANGVQVANNIGFITNLTNFAGFDIYNGAPAWGPTTYIDNVMVLKSDTNMAPPLVVLPASVTTNVYAGIAPSITPADRTVRVVNVWSDPVGFRVTTNQGWLAVSPGGGTVAANSTNELTLTYVDTAGWAVGTSNAEVHVISTNGSGGNEWGTQVVAVAVNMVALTNVFSVTPLLFSNDVWIGATPSQQTIQVRNLGALSFNYTVTTSAAWIASSSNAGIVGAYGTNILRLTYMNTADWMVGTSNADVTVTAATGGVTEASQAVAVVLKVNDFTGVMNVTPAVLSNDVWVGDTPTQRTFAVWNTGDYSFVYAVRTTAAWIAASPTGGTVAALGTNTVRLTYRPTWGWMPGASNATAIVSSVDGFGATQLVTVALTVDPPATNYYVATNGAHQAPFTNWNMAASNLTSAVYKANCYTNASTVVWLSNGVYKIDREVALSNVTVRSANGAESVMLNGGPMRGFKLAYRGATLNGLTITNCIAGRGTNGGAVFVSTGLVVNCRLLRNSATNGGGAAVGAAGVMRNCLVWGNWATNGGGVYYDVGGRSGLVENCTVASNYAGATGNGGGLYTATGTTGLCVNAVVYFNTAGVGVYSNWGTNSSARLVFTNSCVSPTDEVDGVNNIGDDPGLVNVAAGNCRVTQASPCVNTGTNQMTWMTATAVDLAGNRRIRFVRVDMGAYEWYPYQGMGLKVNGVRFENIRFINGSEPLRINGIPITE